MMVGAACDPNLLDIESSDMADDWSDEERTGAASVRISSSAKISMNVIIVSET